MLRPLNTAGLDISTRALLLSLLQSLHAHNSPHIILGMRPQDPIPDWTSHLALIYKDGTVHAGKKEEVLSAASGTLHHGWNASPQVSGTAVDDSSAPVIDLAGVNVTYGDRRVSLHPHSTLVNNREAENINPGSEEYQLDRTCKLSMASHRSQWCWKDNIAGHDNRRAPPVVHTVLQAHAVLPAAL